MNPGGADRALIRAKDVALLVGILTLGGMVWAMYKKPTEWDQAYKDTENLKPRVQSLEEKTAIAEARNVAQMTFIIKELDSIDRKVGR